MNLALSLTIPHGWHRAGLVLGTVPLWLFATLGVGHAIAHAITRHRTPTDPTPTSRGDDREHRDR